MFGIDTDGGIPVCCILTLAFLHDSQATIPLAAQSDRRVPACYEIMDSAYDALEIRTYSESLGPCADHRHQSPLGPGTQGESPPRGLRLARRRISRC